MTEERSGATDAAAFGPKAVLDFHGMGAHVRGPKFRCWRCTQDLSEEVWRLVRESYGPVVRNSHVRIGENQRLLTPPQDPWRVMVVCWRGHENVFSSAGSSVLAPAGSGRPDLEERRVQGSTSFSVLHSAAGTAGDDGGAA